MDVRAWLERHDPDRTALIRAVKMAVVAPTALALGMAIGGAQLSLFGCFGSIAMLLFADFPGDRAARLAAYLGLTVVGCILIPLGTLASRPAWLAVASMAVIGFVVLFGGLLSAAAAAAGRAALLTFVLPVTLPAPAVDIAPRLLGWLLAAAITVPIAVFVLPPAHHAKLRMRAAACCAALARELQAVSDAESQATVTSSQADTDKALTAYRQQLRSTAFRPVALTTGSRLLIQLTDKLEWLRPVASRLPPDAQHRWAAQPRQIVAMCIEILTDAAAVLTEGSEAARAQARERLAGALNAASRTRATAVAFRAVLAAAPSDSRLPAAPGGPEVPTGEALPTAQRTGSPRPAQLHELLYTCELAGSTVLQAAQADARGVVDRLLGRRVPHEAPSLIEAAESLVAGHTTSRSVWFQNSVRGAAGLAIAVLIADVTGIDHGFWVVLGAMSVLRTSALNTGATAARALLGTFLGFLVGAALLVLVGTTAWHLWLLLPVLLLVAGFAPTAVSFTAGQAAFTGTVVVLFNLLQPTGWTVGLVRVVDVLLGCLSGVVAGVLLWPRGAAGQILAALADSYRQSAAALVCAADAVGSTQISQDQRESLATAAAQARASAFRLDDAFREYLAERGTRSLPLDALTTASNGASRLRLAAASIRTLALEPPQVDSTAAPPAGSAAAAASPAVDSASDALGARTAAVQHWIDDLAEALQPSGRHRPEVPVSVPVNAEPAVLAELRRASWPEYDQVFAAAMAVWISSLYVDDLALLETRLGTRIASLV